MRDDEPRSHLVDVNATTLGVQEWEGTGQPVILVHATGFHARCWDQVIRRLDGRHCFAIDMRGHGQSKIPPLPIVWRDLGQDVIAVAEHFGIAGAVGVGHSAGGYAVTMAAGLKPGISTQLLLVDPAIAAPEPYGGPSAPGATNFVLKRKHDWESPQEMYERFRNRRPYSYWTDEALRDYCAHGLQITASGRYELACPPIVEASFYEGAPSLATSEIHDVIRTIEIPVRVLRARQRDAAAATDPAMVDMSASPTDPALASRFVNGEDVFLPHLSHYIPMEAPELVAEHICELLEQRPVS